MTETAVSAARRLDDPTRFAHALSDAASISSLLGDDEAAIRQLSVALPVFESLGDLLGLIGVEMRLSRAHIRTSPAEALKHSELAVGFARATGKTLYEASTTACLAECHVMCGNDEQALEFGARAVRLNRESDRLGNAAHALTTMGLACFRMGRHAEALTHYDEAAATFEAIGDRYDFASTLARAAAVHTALGDVDAARKTYEKAAKLLEGVDVTDDDEVYELLRSALE